MVKQLFNLPNTLTLLRILLVPILVVVLLTKFDGKEYVGLGLFLLALQLPFELTNPLDQRGLARLGAGLRPRAGQIEFGGVVQAAPRAARFSIRGSALGGPRVDSAGGFSGSNAPQRSLE